MEEIPDDVMKRIDAAVDKYGNQPVVTGIKMAMADVLKELVTEERERCAKVAEGIIPKLSGYPIGAAAIEVATAIRSGAPHDH